MLRPDGNQVIIRMYGQGVGDCFLLAFPRAEPAGDDRPVYVLIDCGVIGGTPGGPDRMRAIVDDIATATDGTLDLLVLTHEHWDHLSGFVQAAEEWDQIKVNALWLAWTENGDTEGLPGALKKILERQQRTLALVADQTVRLGLRDRQTVATSLMGFMSDAAGQGLPFAAAPTVADAFQAGKAKVAADQHTYLEPGEVRRLPGTGVDVYVLGPPRDDQRLRQIHPSQRDPETYDATLALHRFADGPSPLNFFAAPLLAYDPALSGMAAADMAADPQLARAHDLFERSFPFDRFTRVSQPLAEETAAAQPDRFPALASYHDADSHWRRIDFDWLSAADSFALQADSLTNNTSLALAFELPPNDEGERAVLLFPADAQVGALLSWDDIPAWNAVSDAAPAQAQPDIDDLLRRTVFVKVGHHGSHNATLKAGGVERLRRGESLTAFVPVSPGVARQIKGWSKMPLDTMLNALSQRCEGRVVLATGDVWPPVPPSDLPAARARIGVEVADPAHDLPAMKRARDGAVVQDAVPLWVQVRVDVMRGE